MSVAAIIGFSVGYIGASVVTNLIWWKATKR